MQTLLLTVLLTLGAVATCAAQPLRVFVGVLPLKSVVEHLGGAHVDVRVMVARGFNPHTYDPTPQQIAALSGAALYVRTGVPFEQAWMARIRSANPTMQILDAILVDEPHSHGEERADDHGHGPHGHHGDPHVWTSPQLLKAMANSIVDRLVQLDPAHAREYMANHAAFKLAIERLDSDISTMLAPLMQRRFMVFHPAWGHFADTYGLIQVPIELEGKEPGAKAMVDLVALARREGIRVIFVQPQFDRRLAARLAESFEGRVVTIDPLAADYAENLRRVARALVEAGQS